MRKHKYRSIPIPTHLNSSNIQTAFDENITKDSYNSGSKYNDNAKIVKESLKKIYYYKCAFCEDTLKNSYGHIEHYRPKSSYYWLAFAWDNLLPSCEICNISKSNHFEIFDKKNLYKQETLADLHTSLSQYNGEEHPKLLHPEIDNYEHLIRFQKKGKIITDDERVKYTIRVCKLNRNKLSELREVIITDHRNRIKKVLKTLVLLEGRLSNELMIKLMKINFTNDLIALSKIDKTFSLVSQSIYNDFPDFINNTSVLKERDKKIILKLF